MSTAEGGSFSIGKRQRRVILWSTKVNWLAIRLRKLYWLALLIFGAIVAVVAIHISRSWSVYGTQFHIFVCLELIAIWGAILFSSWNYVEIIEKIHTYILSGEVTVETNDWYILIKERMYEQLFAVANVFFFLFAIYWITAPLLQLFFIQIIYFLFVWNNYIQSKLSLEMKLNANVARGVRRALDLRHWFYGENGPAVIGLSYCNKCR